jgi:hypothetical protein
VELANYKRLRELTEKWVGLSLRLAKEKRKPTACVGGGAKVVEKWRFEIPVAAA